MVAPHTHRLARYPTWLTRWVGYRAAPPPKRPEYIVWIWSWIGAFCGISLIQAVFGQAKYFIDRDVPIMIASYGATAVLIYGAMESPLAQPRAVFGGHFVGALVGVCITKLFHRLPTEARFDELAWLAASLSCATAIFVMQITGTTHPPAGATALLPAIDADVRRIGWYYLPVVLLTSALIVAVALITNNIQRRYPSFWFHPAISIPAPVSPDLGGPEVDNSSAGTTKDESHESLPKSANVESSAV